MVSYEHKVKNIYLGDDSWSPNEDTIAYFPFKEDFDDKVGNRTLTVNDCTISWWYNNINSQSSYMKLSSTIWWSTLTWSVWYYYWDNSTWWWRNTLFAKEGWTYHHVLFPATSSSGTVWNIGFYSSSFYPSSRILTSWKWYHIVFVKNWTNEKIYVNAELVQDSNSSFDNNSYPLGMISNYDTYWNQWAQWKMSELIFESKERSQQEITKYFKKTRTDYGYETLL